jgi:hypothetical protein
VQICDVQDGVQLVVAPLHETYPAVLGQLRSTAMQVPAEVLVQLTL